jgi:maleate isomerase
MFQPDGWAKTRIGVITPHADLGPESEFQALASHVVSIHAARVPFGAYKADGTMDQTMADDPVPAFAEPPLVDDAAELLASAPLHAIVYGFTSSSYVRGAADDAALKSRLEKRTRGIPVTIPCAAAVAALTRLAAKRLALINPPWFSVDLDQKGARYFESQGFEVVYSGPTDLPSDQHAIEPNQRDRPAQPAALRFFTSDLRVLSFRPAVSGIFLAVDRCHMRRISYRDTVARFQTPCRVHRSISRSFQWKSIAAPVSRL